MLELAPLDRRIINRYQGGFPLVKEPFDKVAAEFDISATELIGRVDHMLARGWLTRFGPLYNAERLGGGLTLAALSVPEEQYRSVTNLVNMQPEVAHNYRRDHLLNKRVFDLVMRFGTSKSPKRTRSSTAYLCPARPASVALRYAPSFRIPRQLPQMARRDYRMPTLFPLRVLRTLRVNSAA
ncbi:MAG: Lrp/AsnC family transcriptional regulator [Sedimenticola sp.]